jgi:hypothetical protein
LDVVKKDASRMDGYSSCALGAFPRLCSGNACTELVLCTSAGWCLYGVPMSPCERSTSMGVSCPPYSVPLVTLLLGCCPRLLALASPPTSPPRPRPPPSPCVAVFFSFPCVPGLLEPLREVIVMGPVNTGGAYRSLRGDCVAMRCGCGTRRKGGENS